MQFNISWFALLTFRWMPKVKLEELWSIIQWLESLNVQLKQHAALKPVFKSNLLRLERSLKIKQHQNLNVADKHLRISTEQFCCLNILCSSGSVSACSLQDNSLEIKESSQPTQIQKCWQQRRNLPLCNLNLGLVWVSVLCKRLEDGALRTGLSFSFSWTEH